MTEEIKEKLLAAVGRFREKRVLVIGDIIVDHFIWGDVTRISPEAPVPVVNVSHDELLLGGGANVFQNIHTLGGTSVLCGLIGDDRMGKKLAEMVAQLPASTDGLISCPERPTTVKTRILARGQQVVRFDREKTGEPTVSTYRKVVDFLTGHLCECDVVVISDYIKGLISQPLMNHIRDTIGDAAIPVIVDPKPCDLGRFHKVTMVTPNKLEAEKMSGLSIIDNQSLSAAAEKILENLDCEAVLITLGAAGMGLLEKGGSLLFIPTVTRGVYDVTGAGDTVVATLALGVAAGLCFGEAALLANIAAGIVVGKVGTATVSEQELIGAIS